MERGIRQLQQRFHVLHGEIRQSPERASHVIMACDHDDDDSDHDYYDENDDCYVCINMLTIISWILYAQFYKHTQSQDGCHNTVSSSILKMSQIGVPSCGDQERVN